MEQNALMQGQAMQQRQMQNALMQMQMQSAQEQAAQRQALDARRRQYLDSVSPANGPARPVDQAQALLAGLKPEEVKALAPPTKKQYVIGPGGNLLDESGTTLFTAPFKPEPERLPPLGQLQQYRETLPPGDPRRKEVQGVIDNQTRPPKYAGGGTPGAAPVPKPEKVLPQAVVKLVTEARDNAAAMDGLATAFKPEYGGKGVYGLGADMQMAASANLGADKDAVNWWKDYRKNIELVERHAMFGASLTTGEQGAWRSADISPGMDPEVIKRNLATRNALAQKVLGNAEQDMVDAGHSEERVRNIAGRNRQPLPTGNPAGAAVQTATNPKTGEKLQLINGQWVPAK
jgi:hypothetical protein